LVQGADGDLYGTTLFGPNSRSPGTVFKITTNGVLTTLFSFTGINGAQPWNGALIQGSDGFFYGTTESGGISGIPLGGGTIFRISASGVFNSLFSFDITSGITPYGGLVEGRDGNFYGTTSSLGGAGGSLASGTVFKITPHGALTPLALFWGTNGYSPFSAVIQGKDGNFYGTTTQGGASYGNLNSVNGQGFGTIFKMTPNGALTTLFSFSGTNGSYPYASLAQGNDGNFYGVTLSGGAYTNQLFPGSGGYAGYGTAFRIATNGTLTTLVSFAGTNGAEVLASLTLGKDGKFYGATQKGGEHDRGTVFRLSIPSPPVIRCPAPTIVECGSPMEMTVQVSDPDGDALSVLWQVNGQPVQTNTIPPSNQPTDASVSFSADLPPGTNVIVVSVTDDATNSASCSTTIIVVDTTPPVILSAAANPNVLWPPNHQMVRVYVNALVADACGSATWKIVSVHSNEPVNGPGDGNTSPDWVITGDHSVSLRAERSGAGAGRVYSIKIQASDAAGNLSELRVVTVRVPKSQAQRR